MPPELWNQIATAGLPSLLMAVAVWWLQKGNNQLVHELNKERSERLDVMEKHIAECDDDRKILRNESKELRDMLIKHLAQS
jgi:hypothetical protein